MSAMLFSLDLFILYMGSLRYSIWYLGPLHREIEHLSVKGAQSMAVPVSEQDDEWWVSSGYRGWGRRLGLVLLEPSRWVNLRLHPRTACCCGGLGDRGPGQRCALHIESSSYLLRHSMEYHLVSSAHSVLDTSAVILRRHFQQCCETSVKASALT